MKPFSSLALVLIFIIYCTASNDFDKRCNDTKTSTKCLSLKDRGYSCDVGSYLYTHCKDTCGYCDGGTIPLPNYKSCKDYENQCQKWAKDNQCDNAKSFMRKYCKKSCRLCLNLTKPGYVVTTTQGTYKKDPCHDVSSRCAQFAAKKHCFYNRRYMSKSCKLTCEMCKPGGKCYDKDSLCPYWAGLKHCEFGNQYRSFMMKKCKYTCVGC